MSKQMNESLKGYLDSTKAQEVLLNEAKRLQGK